MHSQGIKRLSRLNRIVRSVIPGRVADTLYSIAVRVASDKRLLQSEQRLLSVLRNLRRLGYSPRTVLDVGAYIGSWSRSVHPIFPNAAYLLIDPLPSIQGDLRAAATKLGSRAVVSTALLGRDVAGAVPFYRMTTGSSMFEERSSFPRERIELPVTTLDRVVKESELPGAFFLKLDVQGAEIEVLRGAEATLRETEFILLEASVLNYNAGAPLLAEVVRFLDDCRYAPFDICAVYRKKNDNALWHVDLLFARLDSPIRERVNAFENQDYI